MEKPVLPTLPAGRRPWRLMPAIMALVLLLAVTLAGCGSAEEGADASGPASTQGQTATTAESGPTTGETTNLILASTTSTQDSGLFDVLIPAFKEAYPQYVVKVVAVGSGEALKLGETGDADVLLVHSPASEKKFMEAGFGVERKPVMYNDFVIVGPAADPAKIKGLTDAAAALTAIAETTTAFFTRGDDSGTHAKEKSIWKAASIEPAGDWYQTTGQGMGETLTISDQKGGYTLTDRATYLSRKDSLQLVVLVEGDRVLFNQYHVITTKNGRNHQGAADFMNWIVSDEVQQNVIAPFGVEKFGRPLFTPNAGETES